AVVRGGGRVGGGAAGRGGGGFRAPDAVRDDSRAARNARRRAHGARGPVSGAVVRGVMVADGDFQRQALQHLDALYNFAVYLTRNPPEAGDLVQETYLRAFRFSHPFQPGNHLPAWLFQIL